MADSFFDRIRQRFPQLDDLTDQRFQARGRNILLNSRTRKPFPQFTEELVFYVLLLVLTIAEEAGLVFVLTGVEQEFLDRYRVSVRKRQ